MPIIKTIQAGNPLIHSASEAIGDVHSEEVKAVVIDLVDTMRAEDLVGMAAPQIGVSARVFITEIRETQFRKSDIDVLRVFINPRIVSVSENAAVGYEGCGSVASAEFFGQVERPKEVTVEATDEKGEIFTFTAQGLLARVIQHELDHLDGILFTEKISDMKKVMSKEEYIKSRSK